MIDTFRINRFEHEWLKLNDSDNSITEVTVTTTNMYDALLNKYYKKIMALLNPKDKSTLIQAQRSWVSYRDSEKELNKLVAGIQFEGGTLQILTNASSYKNIVVDRVKGLFQDYQAILQNDKYKEIK